MIVMIVLIHLHQPSLSYPPLLSPFYPLTNIFRDDVSFLPRQAEEKKKGSDVGEALT